MGTTSARGRAGARTHGGFRRAAVVLVFVDRSPDQVGQVLDILAVRHPAFMPGGREGVDDDAPVSLAQLGE